MIPMTDKDSPSPYLQHYGVKGMKWGVRRYRNADGTLTEAGKKRYRSDIQNAKAQKKQSILARDRARKKGDLKAQQKALLDINRPFYASHNTYDKIIYGGGYARELRKNHGKVIKNVVSIKDGGLKVAPRNTVTEHVNRLIKNDPQFRKNLEHLFEGVSQIKDLSLEGRQKLAKKALKEIQNGTISPKTYDLLNMHFNDADASNTESPIFKNVGGHSISNIQVS